MARTTVLSILFFYISCTFLYAYSINNSSKELQVSKDLKIIKISDHSYIHVSYITLVNGDKFPCNGFIYTNKKEAYIFDSPANDQATLDLIHWLQKDLKTHIKGVVFNHFHADCTKGNAIFKKYNIPSIASKKTANLLKKKNNLLPDQIFTEKLKLTLNNKTIFNRFFGEAHTQDNIVSYFPDENILFGGCLVKSMGGRKGNLEDANTNAWSTTVSAIKEAYPNIAIVIPGHGDYGTIELLDYTISLFKN